MSNSRNNTANVVCPFPTSPKPSHVGLAVLDGLHLTAPSFRAVQQAVMAFPLPYWDVLENANHDEVAGHRWLSAYLKQQRGPFIGNFTISGSSGAFTVVWDDVEKVREWNGFQTVEDAVGAVWAYVEKELEGWGLRVG